MCVCVCLPRANRTSITNGLLGSHTLSFLSSDSVQPPRGETGAFQAHHAISVDPDAINEECHHSLHTGYAASHPPAQVCFHPIVHLHLHITRVQCVKEALRRKPAVNLLHLRRRRGKRQPLHITVAIHARLRVHHHVPVHQLIKHKRRTSVAEFAVRDSQWTFIQASCGGTNAGYTVGMAEYVQDRESYGGDLNWTDSSLATSYAPT